MKWLNWYLFDCWLNYISLVEALAPGGDGPQQSPREQRWNKFRSASSSTTKGTTIPSLYGGTLASWCIPGPIADGVNVILEGVVHYYLREGAALDSTTRRGEKRAPASPESRENGRDSSVDKESYDNCWIKTQRIYGERRFRRRLVEL